MSGFVAVHTGAGNISNSSQFKRACKESCIRANEILKAGGSALDACEAAIKSLEDRGETNAGFGSNLTWDGRVECDASIMDGSTLRFGACTNVSTVCNPISLARALCDRQAKLLKCDRIPPMVLAGNGASQYAEEINLPTVEEDKLISGKSRRVYEHYRKKFKCFEAEFNIKVTPLDTVGAVCVDSEGNCAAGCSSGGMIIKIPGRVGQAATYGAGCWAARIRGKSCATCTTGNGEYLMKTLLAREIVNGLLKSDCAVTSLHKTFKEEFLESPFLDSKLELYAGALSILYDPTTGDGEVLWCHTTNALCIAHMTTTQKTAKYIESTLPNNMKAGYSTVVNGQHFKLPI